MLVSSTVLFQNHNIDSFTFKALKSEPRLNQLPPTTIHYHIASNQKLTITLTGNTPTAYLQTLVQGQVIQSAQVPLAFPFDLQTLLQRVPYHDLPDVFHEKFTVRLYKGAYTLFPLLKGGGGALTCAGPKPKKPQVSPYPNVVKDDRQGLKNEIDQKKNDVELFYLPERDGYPKKDDPPSLGAFYKKLVENVFEKIEKGNREKLQLSFKNFRKYIAGEIQSEEAKQLQARFEESLKANKELKVILEGMITLLRRELYQETSGQNNSEDSLFKPLFPYEEKIMVRMIISTLLKSINPYLNEAEGFEVKVGKKILKCVKELMKIRHSEKHGGEKFLFAVSAPKRHVNLTKTPGALATSTNTKSDNKYKRLLSLSYGDAIEQAQLYVLRGLSWNKYSAALLVKHYNSITSSKDSIDERNRTIIENIISNMLNLYQEKEDTLTPGEINELVGLGGIQHHPKESKERTLFQRLLSHFASDINNDLVFDSLKTQALAAIIFQHSSDGEASRIDDDLKQCMDVLHRQVERRLFTAENQNMQDCMDAMNLVLYTMASRNVKGLRKDKEMEQLANTFKDQLPSLTKNAFSLILGNKNDPSLRIKAKYAQEALKRIGYADADLSDEEAVLLEAAPAVIGIVSGIFTFNVDSVISGLKTLAAKGLSYYSGLGKDWYDEVNKVYFLANMEFEEFEKRYFNPAAKAKVKNAGEEFVYFISRELYKIARTTDRTYADRKKSIEWLGDIYEGKTINGAELSHFNFIGKNDIKTYLQKCLSDLARMPREESLSFDAGLAEVANSMLGRLGLEPIKQDAAFEFISNKAPDSNGLLISAFKSAMTLEYAFSVMYTNCTAYYEKEIKHLDYIEIEGEKYINKVKENEREPLWSSSTSHALDTFLNSPKHPVLLIQGDAGTGKSTFLKIIEYQQWKSYKQGQSDYIPIFIRLSEIINPAKCLNETFQTQHFSHKVLEQLKEEGSKRNYLFIFDGYDELKAPKNLYEVNKLAEYGKSAKVIVTSREEYLKGYGNYIKYFRPKTGDALLEYRITPLSERQRDIYLGRRAILNKKIYEQTSDKALKVQLKDWMDVYNYIDAIKKIPGLGDLIKTPYMLTIITSILPSLESDAKSRVTKANIYKVFTMKGFEVEMNRILENSKEDLPKGLDLEKSFYEFAKDLAINLYLTDRTSIKIEGSNYVMDYTKTQPQKQEVVQEPTNTDEAQRFSRFFSDDPKVKLARSGVPITMMEGQVRFNHKSIMEYFAARCFYDELKFCPVDALHKRSLSWKLLKGGTQTNQESDVLNFLKEMIEDNNYKQTHLEVESPQKPLDDALPVEVESPQKPLDDDLAVEVKRPQKPLDKAQPASATSSPEKKFQVTSPLSSSKLSAKFTASWKPTRSKKLQHVRSPKETKVLELKEDFDGQTINKEKEDQSGVHVTTKLRDAIKLKGDNKITDNFYLNVMMIISSSCPEVMEFLSVEEIKTLEQIPNTPIDFKKIIFQALIYYDDWAPDSTRNHYTNQYLSYKLNGKYKGEVSQRSGDQRLYTIFAHGKGEITYDNGDFYTGYWVDDKREGYGICIFAKSDQFRVYDGYWKDGMFDGEGKMEFVDPCVYYGGWKQGAQEGWGEFIQYTNQNKDEIVGVYKGFWSQGQKHGTGTIYFEQHRYHGKWNRGTVVEGQMEFANGTTVPGIYLEDQGFKPNTGAGKMQFSHEYSVKVTNTKIFVRQRVSQFIKKKQDKNNSTPTFGKDSLAEEDLLAQDDNGNSPVLLYFRGVRSRALNEMKPHFRALIAVDESIHANKRGENLIHMLICNKSISLVYKNNLLDELYELNPLSYTRCILSASRKLAKKETAEIPLLYAVERLRMLEIAVKIKGVRNDNDLAKLELIKKLAPQGIGKKTSERLEDMKIDPLDLALLEFDGENHQGLYVGPASRIKEISDLIRVYNDNVLVALTTSGEQTLLWKLVEQKFFYLHGKNLRYVLLNNLTCPNKKETLEELFVKTDESILDAPLFKIRDYVNKIDSKPLSPINTIVKEKKQIILEEYSKFMNSLALEYFQRHMRIQDPKESCVELLNRPLFKKVLEVNGISDWKALCSGLSTQFKSVEQGEELLHHVVQSLLGIYEQTLKDKEIFDELLIWLATPQQNGIYSSPKYCFEIFVKYCHEIGERYNKFAYGLKKRSTFSKNLELFQIYKWLEDYCRFAKLSGENKNTKIKPEEFKLEELADILFDFKLSLFQPLVSQSLVVAAIELKDANLALKLIEKRGYNIEKLHKWKTVWLHESKFFEASDSTKPCFKGLNKDRDPYYVVVRNAKTDPKEIIVDEGFIVVNKECKSRFYENQLYFADPEISNILLVSEVPENKESVIKVKEGVGIIEIEQGKEQMSLNREEVENSVDITEVEQTEEQAPLNYETGISLFNCLTDELMSEVLKKLKSIYINGFDRESKSKGDDFILGLFFQNDYLLYDEDYIHKCLTFEDIYNDAVAFDYRKAMIDYVVKQYLEAFRKGTPASDIIKQPNIDKITDLLRSAAAGYGFSPAGTYKFFMAIINKLIVDYIPKRARWQKRRASVRKPVLFLQEFILSLSYYFKNDMFMQLSCDSYMKIESKVMDYNDVDDKIKDEEVQCNLKNLAKGEELLRQALETECKGQDISKEEVENKRQAYKTKMAEYSEKKTNYDNEYNPSLTYEYLEYAREAARTIETRSLVELKASTNPPKLICKVLEALAILFDVREPTWQKGCGLLADPSISENMQSFDFESVSSEKIEKVQKCVEGITVEQISEATDLFIWVINGIKVASATQKMRENAELEKEYLNAKTDFLDYKQRQYKVSVLKDQIANIEEIASSLKYKYEQDRRYDSYDWNKGPKEVKTYEKIDVLFEFFVKVVYKYLDNPPSRKAAKFLFEWVDGWLNGKDYHSIKILIDALCSDKLKFENITPFASLIYQRLLVLAIEKGSPELAGNLLDHFKDKFKRIKSWTIFDKDSSIELTNEASETSGDEETDDNKLQDLKSRDEQLKYFISDSQVVVLVPTKSDIEQKTSITPETEDVVMIVEEDNYEMLSKLTQDNMKEVLRLIRELDIYVGDIENVFDKNVGLLCKLQTFNYPLSKKAQAKLMSPDEWDCKDYKDYLFLLLNHPNICTDPIGWLLKNTSVLKKIMESLNTEKKAKDFFNNFVSKHSGDSINSAEEILLTKVVKKYLDIIFAAYLGLIKMHPDKKNRFSHVYKECVLKDLDPETAQELLLHLQEYPESCTELEQFVNTTLQKVEGYTDLCYYQLVKQLLENYLSGKKTAEQTRNWIKWLFSKSTVFVGASCSNSELLETLVYNLLKSMIDAPKTEQEDTDLNCQVLKERFGQVSCLFDTMMECLGYKVIVSENGGLKLTRFNSEPLLTQSRLATLDKELQALIKVSTIELSSASACKGYNEFLQKIGISLPPSLDVISFSILSIQVIMHLQLIEELELESIKKPDVISIGYNTNIKFTESSLEPVAPIQYSIKDSEKSLSISYYLDSFQKLPSANLFRTNTDNFCQVKSALFPKSVLQLYDPLLVSIQCLHDSLLSDSIEDRFETSLQQSLPHFSLFSHQNTNKITLCEKLLYNCLYCLCLQTSSVDQSNSEEKLSKVFEKAKEGTMPLLNLALAVLGMEIQFDSADALSVKQSSQPLCSVDDLRRLESYLAELFLITVKSRAKSTYSKTEEYPPFEKISNELNRLGVEMEKTRRALELYSAELGRAPEITTVKSRKKLTDRKAEECVGYQDMKEKLSLGLPEGLTAFNFCVLSVSLSIEISLLLGRASASENAVEESPKKLEFRLVPITSSFPHVNYLLSVSEPTVPLYYQIRKLETVLVPMYSLDIVPFSDIEKSQLSILRSKAPTQSPEYVAFTREFLVSYCGKQQYTTPKQDTLALFKNMVYHHERLASCNPEQLDKIRLLEHIMGIFLTVFDKMDESLDKLIISKVNQYFIKDKDITPLNFLKMMITALGYNLEIEKSSQTMSLTHVRQPICHIGEFLNVRGFLITTKRASETKGPKAKDCPGYGLFEITTCFSLPKECDTFSLYIFLIDLVQCLTLIEDLTSQDETITKEAGTEKKYVYKLRLIPQPEGSLQPMSLKEEGNIKIVNIHYRVRSTKEWPEGHKLEFNEYNDDDLRRFTGLQQQTKKEQSKKGEVNVVKRHSKLRSVFLRGWKPSEKLKKEIIFDD